MTELHDEFLYKLNQIHWDFKNADTGYFTHSFHSYPAKFIPQIPKTLIQILVGEITGK
jgi:site-specific DNA-methyltransferase (cytosine-N4-specific)